MYCALSIVKKNMFLCNTCHFTRLMFVYAWKAYRFVCDQFDTDYPIFMEGKR